jgi:hypothetical protein
MAAYSYIVLLLRADLLADWRGRLVLRQESPGQQVDEAT